MSLLESINYPKDLKKLKQSELPKLAEEIREFMLESVSHTGGHLAPSLGTVELTIALHYCYDTPNDKIIWDVGHQAYTHKILTGRKDKFNTLRKLNGISGFPHVTESEYDALTVGHASTSISAALGMAMAREVSGENYRVVAVIGDGALSGGLAFEGLNNLGNSSTDMTVILNDNEMSIAKNVGAMSKYLTGIITNKQYNKLKTDIWEMLGSLSGVGKKIRSTVHNIDDKLKRIITPGKFFEDMGLRYIGPIDGHNINDLINVLNFTKENSTEPLLVHVITKKGKGYSFAENNATKYHGIGSFSRNTGDVNASSGAISYSNVFGKALVELAEKDKKIVAVTAAMPDGTGLQFFRDKFPERLFDVGIAEGHAVTFSAGLALSGVKPVVAVYSTFMQRAYDHLIHDVALDNLNVVFCLDRAGLVGDDGPTHHGTFDISYLQNVPNVTIMAPSDENELRDMLFTAIYHISGPVFIRYPRGGGSGVELKTDFSKIDYSKPVIRREGEKIAIVSIGDTLKIAKGAADILKESSINATLVDARFAKPLDEDFYLNLFSENNFIFTIESNSLVSGFGSVVTVLANNLEHKNKRLKIHSFGYPDKFIEQGTVPQLLEELGLTSENIAKQILSAIK